MANITGQVTVDQLSILEVDNNPSLGGGTVGSIGSVALFNSGTVGLAFLKTGTAATAWELMTTSSLFGTAVLGNANLSTVGAIPFVASAGTLTQDSLLNWNNTTKELTIGPAAVGTFANNYFSMNANVNGFAQANVQNLNAGTVASSDLVASADNGDDSAGYVNVGINSSINADPTFTIAGARDSYVSANGGKLVMGTEGAFDVRLYTGGTLAANERMRLTAGGQVVIGGSPAIDISGLGAFPIFQIIGTSGVQMANITYSNDTVPSVVNLLKSRGTTLGTQAILTAGDEIGRIQFRGSDGVNFQAAGALRVQVDAITPVAGSMPGRINLWTTPNGAITPVEQFRIDSTGLATFFGIANASVGMRLGNMTDTTNGNMRFNGVGVEFYRGSTWRDLSTQKVNFEDMNFLTLGAGTNEFGVTSVATGTGASYTIQGAATLNGANGLGILNCGTTAAVTSVAACDFFGSVNKMLFGSTPFTVEWRIFLPALSTATVAYQIRAGFQDAATANDPNNGVFLTYTHSLNAGSWVGITRSASTSTSVNSSVAVTANTWIKLRAEINAAGTQVDFYVDNGSGSYTLIGSSTSNIPTTGMRPVCKINKTSANATATTANVDYCLWLQER